MAEEWLDTKDIAREMDVGADTVRRWLKSPKNPEGIPATLIGKSYRIKKRDWNLWKQQREGERKRSP